MSRTLQMATVLLSLGPAIALAERGGDELKLSDDRGFNSASTGLIYALTDAQEIDLRQSVSIHDTGENDSRWRGDTRSHYDFHYDDVDFGSSELRPFVGANADYLYGSNVDDCVMAGPEAGLKVDVQPTTLVVVRAEYQSLYQDADKFDEALIDGSPAYRLSIDFRF